ncbi:hypothetical protein [Oculatella sp. LEGE 06141]
MFQANNTNFVELNGFRFETFISDGSISVPESRPNLTVPIQLGIRITNKTSSPKRFLDFYLTPEILSKNSKLVGLVFARNVTLFVSESNFKLLKPGESTIFKLNSKLTLYQGTMRLSILSMDGGVWTSFNSLEFGSYKVRFHYRTEPPIGHRFLGKDSKGNPIYDSLFEFDDLWTGSIFTPYRILSLIK